MADKSMKAVIVAEVDPRGVAKGVAATNKELQKLNKSAASASTSAAISAGISMAEMGMSALQQIFSAVDKRFGELNAIANKYSAAAAGARIAADVAAVQDNVRIAKALTPGAIQATQAESDIKAGEAARMERNAGAMNAGMGATARLKSNMGSIADMGIELAGSVISGWERVFSGDFAGAFGTSEGGRNQFGELFNAQNYAYQNETPGRGMGGSTEMAEQTEVLKQIRDSLKGGR
jgi:hypothetical protein